MEKGALMNKKNILIFPLFVLLCTGTIVSGQTIPSDAELLNATPIPKARMELIWLDPPKLEDLAKKVKKSGGALIAEYYDAADNDRREYETTSDDIVWAKKVEKIIDKAWAAAQAGQLDEAIKYYKQALVLAPGGDFFLMSIGVAYVQLGEKERGIRFLERAVQISPKNGRIRRNLDRARDY
jgi:tetratricopeptide (TPR) repeat protein